MGNLMIGSVLEKSVIPLVKKVNPCLVYDPNRPIETSSSGSVIVDNLTGCGGLLAKKRLVELIGAESSGKSTLSMQSCREALRKGWKGVYVDYEGTYDNLYGESLGLKIDHKNFEVIQPITAEEAELAVDTLVKEMGDEIDFFVLDSIAACRPKAFLEKAPDDPLRIGLHSQYWSYFVDRISKYTIRYNIAFLFTNQLRSKIPSNDIKFSLLNTGVGAGFDFKNQTVTTTGGNTLRHYMNARYILVQSGSITEEKDKEEIRTANWCFIKNIKNKMGNPFKKAKFVVKYGAGTDDLEPILEILRVKNYVVNSGAWFSFNKDGFTDEKFKGRSALLDYIAQPAILDKVKSLVLDYEVDDIEVKLEEEEKPTDENILKI